MSRAGLWVGVCASTAIAAGWLVGLGVQDGAERKGSKFGPAHAYEEGERRGRYDEPEEFARMWEARREGSGEFSPAQINYAISEQVRDVQSRSTSTLAPAWGFQELGPGNFGGRSRGLIVHPTNTNRLLFSSVSGGLWRSEDEGQSWTPVADFIANLAVGSIVIDPDNADRVFIGTGEGFFNGDAARGAGIFVSNDFGTTWSQLPATNNPDFHFVNRIAMVAGTDTMVAATRSGLWRSIDLGANWQRVATDLHVDNAGYQDVKTDPSMPNRLLAYHTGSADGRGPIPQLTVAGLPNIVGVQMAVGPATPVAPLNATVVLANDGVGTTTDGCEAFPAASLTGRIVLIDRGSCPFVNKIRNAQTAGAAYVVIGQNVPDAPFAGGAADPTITISSMMISLSDANLLKDLSNGNVAGGIFANGFENPGSVTFNAQVSGPQQLTNYLARSTDAGATWTQLTAANGLPESNITRAEIGWGSDGVVYTAFADNSTAQGEPETRGLWRSADGGASWTQTASTAAFIERQGTYDLVTAVAPNDSNRVYLGAVDQFVTSDAGATITKNTFWNPNGTPAGGLIRDYVHADHHAYTFKPGVPTTIYTASDGGVQRSTDSGANYVELNFGLNAAMPNNVSVSPNGRVIHGTQDNGSQFTLGFDDSVWLEWSGGDGGNTAADQQDSNFFYSSRPFGDFFGTGDGGSSEADLPLSPAGSNANSLFYGPIAIDVNNGNRMLIGVAGAQFSANARSLAASTWTAITMPAGYGGLTNTLTISPLDGTKAYAGSTAGNIVRITGLGTTNTAVSIQSNLPVGSDISQILVDRDDANHLYVVLADYGTGAKVYESFNDGGTWTSIQGGLPIVPMFAIAQVPGVTGQLVLGSEIGLWFGTRTGTGPVTWDRFNYGIPYTRVTGITVAGSTMYFSVYGRSTFKASRSPLLVSIGEPRSDTGCDSDGFLDQAEAITVPVTIRNLSNQFVGSIDLFLASNNVRLTSSSTTGLSVNGFSSITTNLPITMGTAAGACPDAVTLTATATPVGGIASAATRSLGIDQNAATLTTLSDGAESANTLLTSSNQIGTEPWTRVNTQSNTGTFSWFASNPGTYSDKNLGSPWMDVTSPTASLAFALRYDTEGDADQRWDGTVLEARSRNGIDGQPSKWIDIGSTSSIAYDGPLFNNTTLGPSRNAWSGTQTTWRNANVSLAAFNGQQMQFRFRFVSDTAVAVNGFWIDDIAVTGVSLKALPTCDNICN